MKLLKKLLTYLKESRAEVKKVNWPTQKEVLRKSAVVVLFSLAFAVVLGGFDLLFSRTIATLFSDDASAPVPDAEGLVPEHAPASEPIEVEIGGEGGNEPIEVAPEAEP